MAQSRIFVEPFGNKAGAEQLRSSVIALLSHNPAVKLAADPTNSDYILTGAGETYVRGYLSLNPRVRYVNHDSRPLYGGFLSVELKDSQHETIWSYLVTPRRFGPEDVYRDLAEQIVKKLVPAIPAKPKVAPRT